MNKRFTDTIVTSLLLTLAAGQAFAGEKDTLLRNTQINSTRSNSSLLQNRDSLQLPSNANVPVEVNQKKPPLPGDDQFPLCHFVPWCTLGVPNFSDRINPAISDPPQQPLETHTPSR